jgi:uncharacterized phage protein (TIGR01671 family)
MREILFRGKSPASGLWIIGDLCQYPSGAKAIKANDMLHIMEVIPDTVGQFTGLTDKNGTKIFEEDIVKIDIAGLIFNAVCKFHSGSFGLVWHYMGTDRWQAFTSICNVEYEVIGNVYDTPELMEDESHG